MTKKHEQRFRDQEDNIKHGRLEAEKWTEKYNGKKMANIFQKFNERALNTYPKIQQIHVN